MSEGFEGHTATPGDESRVVPMRLQKFLARAGVASRRGSEDLMTAGRVRVNGEVIISLGAKVDPLVDEVWVDGVRVQLTDEPVYLMLHKPSGYVTTMSDPQGRPTVAGLVPVSDNPGLFPVGRLDFDTTGALLFTTDGELAHRLLHPRWKVPKTYEAVVDGIPTLTELQVLRRGVTLDDGVTAPAQVRMLRPGDASALVEITISEGRKRQVKRMFSKVGHPVISLHRSRFGPLLLGSLAEGAYRALTDEELALLRKAVEMDVGADTGSVT